ncbi:acyl-CoA thioesterase [Namhaeicola litoreus]|uniref:Acyl-CoA thioesterase n=1 Tax=Namhaeicola litoreus TaxID=1052145 RepID=A0ABW3Y494_9FLAO
MIYSSKYTITKKVEAKDIDRLHHVNNVVYLEWVNEIAKLHWEELAKDHVQDYYWVVRKHVIEYFKSALLNDVLTISTWVGTSKGVLSDRYVEIKIGETILVKVKSTWCLIDAQSHRPKRITEDMIRLLKP